MSSVRIGLLNKKRGNFHIQEKFAGYVKDIIAGRPVSFAFVNRFGNLRNFKREYSNWWLSLGDNPTANNGTYGRTYLLGFCNRTATQRRDTGRYGLAPPLPNRHRQLSLRDRRSRGNILGRLSRVAHGSSVSAKD